MPKASSEAMNDFQSERWVALFQAAIEELEHARMTGRIRDANAAIVSRIERLRHIPGLHLPEQMAIEDAVRTLKFLEQLEEHYQVDQKREVAGHALEKLRSVKPAIKRLSDQSQAG